MGTRLSCFRSAVKEVSIVESAISELKNFYMMEPIAFVIFIAIVR
jgi:hypothetical protein